MYFLKANEETSMQHTLTWYFCIVEYVTARMWKWGGMQEIETPCICYWEQLDKAVKVFFSLSKMLLMDAHFYVVNVFMMLESKLKCFCSNTTEIELSEYLGVKTLD